MKHIHQILGCSLTAVVAMAGCGGGSGPAGGASRSTGVSVSIQWPARAASRLIPEATNSIKVTVTDSAQVAKTAVVSRPAGQTTASATIIGLAPGAATINATAVASTDGTGTPLAAGSETATLAEGTTTTAPALVLNSTITALAVSPTSITVGTGKTISVTASGADSGGHTVLLTGAKLNWSLTGTVASVPAHGNPVTITAGASAGTATLVVQDTESGKAATVPVTVSSSSVSGNVMVLDQTNTRVAFLSDAAPGVTDTTVSLGSKTTVYPEDMARDSDGNLYIAEGPGSTSAGGAIVELDPSGHEVGRFYPKAKLSNGVQYDLVPYQIAVGPAGGIYFYVQLVDEVHGGVTHWLWAVDDINSYPVSLRQRQLPFGNLVGIAVDTTQIFVTNGTQFYHANEATNDGWTGPYFSKGSGTNQFDMGGVQAPGGNHVITLDDSGHLYVADFNNQRIVKIDRAGFFFGNPFNFTPVHLDSSGTNGATAFKPISVALDGTNQHVVFSGMEVKDPALSDALPPTGTNVVNSFVEKMDVASFASGTPVNRKIFGGLFTSVGAADRFGRPVAVASK